MAREGRRKGHAQHKQQPRRPTRQSGSRETEAWQRHNRSNRCTIYNLYTMDDPKADALNLSDSDSDVLFDTPAARKNKSKGAHDDAIDAGEGAAANKARTKESHYSTEEARDAALRRELESVRNVNKVIEGVVESLQKAKNNMDVCIS